MPRPRRTGDVLAAAAILAAVVFVAGADRRTAANAPAVTVRAGLVLSPAHADDPYDAVIAVRTRKPLVALTFDDGPDPRFTPPVLALLAANHAHATFFDIGRRITAHRALARATVDAGNEIGDHTLDHPLLPELPAGGIAAQIDGGLRAASEAGLPRTSLLRPPHGAFDPRVTALAAQRGLRVIGWDVVVERALHGRSAGAAAAEVLRRLRPGSIVLAHDGRGDRSRSVAVIARLLPALRRAGMHVVTVSTLLRARESPTPPDGHRMASRSPLSLPMSSVPSAASAG